MTELTRAPNGQMLPGHSANLRGRPPKSRNLLTLFKEKRDEKVAISVPDLTAPGGKRVKTMTRMEAWVVNLWNTAIACDPKASAMVLSILRAIGELDPQTGERQDMNPDDAAVLEALIRRLSDKKLGDLDG